MSELKIPPPLVPNSVKEYVTKYISENLCVSVSCRRRFTEYGSERIYVSVKMRLEDEVISESEDEFTVDNT